MRLVFVGAIDKKALMHIKEQGHEIVVYCTDPAQFKQWNSLYGKSHPFDYAVVIPPANTADGNQYLSHLREIAHVVSSDILVVVGSALAEMFANQPNQGRLWISVIQEKMTLRSLLELVYNFDEDKKQSLNAETVEETTVSETVVEVVRGAAFTVNTEKSEPIQEEAPPVVAEEAPQSAVIQESPPVVENVAQPVHVQAQDQPVQKQQPDVASEVVPESAVVTQSEPAPSVATPPAEGVESATQSESVVENDPFQVEEAETVVHSDIVSAVSAPEEDEVVEVVEHVEPVAKQVETISAMGEVPAPATVAPTTAPQPHEIKFKAEIAHNVDNHHVAQPASYSAVEPNSSAQEFSIPPRALSQAELDAIFSAEENEEVLTSVEEEIAVTAASEPVVSATVPVEAEPAPVATAQVPSTVATVEVPVATIHEEQVVSPASTTQKSAENLVPTVDIFVGYEEPEPEVDPEFLRQQQELEARVEAELAADAQAVALLDLYVPPVASYKGKDKKTIVVASVSPVSGSTFVASNAAVWVSLRGISTAYVEHFTNEPSLYHVLNGKVFSPDNWRSIASRVNVQGSINGRDYWHEDNLFWFVKDPSDPVLQSTSDKLKQYMQATDVAQYRFLDVSSHWSEPELAQVFDKCDEIWAVFTPTISTLMSSLMEFKDYMGRWSDKVKFISNKMDTCTSTKDIVDSINFLIANPKDYVENPNEPLSKHKRDYYVWRDESIAVMIPNFPSATVNKAEWNGKVFAQEPEGRKALGDVFAPLLHVSTAQVRKDDVEEEREKRSFFSGLFRRKDKTVMQE